MQEFRTFVPSKSISTNDIIGLLRISVQKQYNAKDLDKINISIEENITRLLEQDYVCQSVSNTNGELSLSYPRNIPMPVVDKWSEIQTSKIQSSVNIRDLFVRSRLARYRCRFIVPVIYADGKYICRSSTLSSWGEIYPRFSMDHLKEVGNRFVMQPVVTSSTPAVDNEYSSNINIIDDTFNNVEQPEERTMFDKLRGADVDLLKVLDVGSIVNLMVQKKNTLFGMNLTASEKLDKYNRYKAFQMMLLPYPGCEHFRELDLQQYNGEQMFYDWTLPKNDAILEVPSPLSSCIYDDWSFWRSWNSIDLTKNYLQIILRQLETNQRGILIHCLSGWDRTPLFISLLRLSLWADGYIHQSLTVEEILYLTLAYDWYLFGHNLSERLLHAEEILYFTFIVLSYLIGNEFRFQPSNITRQQSMLIATGINGQCSSEHRACSASLYPDIKNNSTINVQQNTSNFASVHPNENKTIRKEKLLAVSDLFYACYQTVVPNNLNKPNSRSLGSNITHSVKNFFVQRRPPLHSYFK